MLWQWMIWPFKRLYCATTSHNWNWHNLGKDPRNIFKLTAGEFPCLRCSLIWNDRKGSEYLKKHLKPLIAHCACGNLEVTINYPGLLRDPLRAAATILNFGGTLVCGGCTTYFAEIKEKNNDGAERKDD